MRNMPQQTKCKPSCQYYFFENNQAANEWINLIDTHIFLARRRAAVTLKSGPPSALPVPQEQLMVSKIRMESRRRRPVVIFGGFGMTRSHCTRLARLYRRLGAGDILVLTHPLHQMVVPALGERQARKLAAFFASAGYEEEVTVHLFSGSVFLAGRVLRLLPEKTKNAIKSIIFECSPMDCRAENFGRFVSWRLNQRHRFYHTAPFIPLRPLIGLNRRFERELHEERFLIPTGAALHFIQSHDDPIIDPAYVDAYRRDLASRGHRTSGIVHHGARHCRALTDCAAAYHADLRAFLHAQWGISRNRAA